MIERLASAGSGASTVLVGDKALHSRYDPEGEAERYVSTLNLGESIRFFILIEPGLGYIIPALRRKNPRARILVIHISDFFNMPDGPRPEGPGAASWSPGRGPLQAFLEQEIPDLPSTALRIVEWRPALAAYGAPYLQALTEVAEFIKRIDANTRTVRGFGRRWFRNFFKNLALMKRILGYPRSAQPWIITGAGPSLEEALPEIRRLRERNCRILAASSSAAALRAGGIPPDLVISTDGGGWALLHLYEALRGDAAPPLAAALTAALPGQCAELPILPISDGSLWQRIILEKLEIPHIVLPQRGTVTAAALDLALTLTTGPIILCGMDLSPRDIRTHARPYGFDRLQEEGATRLNPGYSQTYVRAGSLKAAGSYRIYAEWFNRQLRAYPKRLFTLGNNHPVFDGLGAAGGLYGADSPGDSLLGGGDLPVTGGPLGSGLLGGGGLPVTDGPEGGPLGSGLLDGGVIQTPPERPLNEAVRALIEALENPGTAPSLLWELVPLLLPGEEDALRGTPGAEMPASEMPASGITAKLTAKIAAELSAVGDRYGGRFGGGLGAAHG
jgi:hypothetical protein